MIIQVVALSSQIFSDAELKGPFGIALNAEGTMAVSDFYGHSVYVFDNEGIFLQKIGQFKQPVDVVFMMKKLWSRIMAITEYISIILEVDCS